MLRQTIAARDEPEDVCAGRRLQLCLLSERLRASVTVTKLTSGGGGGVLPYMGYIGMCGPKGYGFSAVLVINRVSNLADSGHK